MFENTVKIQLLCICKVHAQVHCFERIKGNYKYQVNAFNCLFQYVLDNHALIKHIKIHLCQGRSKGLMNTRDMWHKKAMKTNNK